jgi:hypothetical protein
VLKLRVGGGDAVTWSHRLSCQLSTQPRCCPGRNSGPSILVLAHASVARRPKLEGRPETLDVIVSFLELERLGDGCHTTWDAVRPERK